MYKVILVTLSGGWKRATNSLTPPPVRDEGLFLLPVNFGLWLLWPVEKAGMMLRPIETWSVRTGSFHVLCWEVWLPCRRDDGEKPRESVKSKDPAEPSLPTHQECEESGLGPALPPPEDHTGTHSMPYEAEELPCWDLPQFSILKIVT